MWNASNDEEYIFLPTFFLIESKLYVGLGVYSHLF